MRRFSSYGPVNPNEHYYAPRTELINRAVTQLVGDNWEAGGHYITVWAPRQAGKTSTMIQVISILDKDPRFDVVLVNLESLKFESTIRSVLETIAEDIGRQLKKSFKGICTEKEFLTIFENQVLDKPLILIIDEFDALPEIAISTLVTIFRGIYNIRRYQLNKPKQHQTYLLHAVALVGLSRAVGIENEKKVPYNVQRSLHITNLTFEEVQGMFQWYQQESGQEVEPAVIEKLYQETKGQPGITSWLGEVLTEGVENHPNDLSKPIRLEDFENIYRKAMNVLPNNNIINLISKAKLPAYKPTIIELFKTEEPMEFSFDNEELNFLYMNGIIEPEDVSKKNSVVKFASPFVQKRLFNFFSRDIFFELGKLTENFFTVPEYIFPDYLDIPIMLSLYQSYLDRNKGWLFKDAPRRSDLRIFEAVFHFNLYAYLGKLLWNKKVSIYPEFPTGNGKIDLLLRYTSPTRTILYGLELKSFTDLPGYRDSLVQTALYGQQLGLQEIFLISFVESIDETNQKKFETPYNHPENKVTVYPIFIQTGKI